MKGFRIVIYGAFVFFVFLNSAHGQDLASIFSQPNSISVKTIQLFLALTLLSLAPGIAMMVTCFPFMVTVLAILRQAIGLQQSPPNMLIVSLAIFLTWFVMEPVFSTAWDNGFVPLLNGEIGQEDAQKEILGPFRAFMVQRVDATTVQNLSNSFQPREQMLTEDLLPFSILVPAFLLSEIKRGFEVGFLIFLPFLVIDLVVAAILMSMGMMMVPPSTVSLPFKLIFFVVADGWSLLAGALVKSYG